MIHNFWLFALASLLLNLTPGNDMLYVASRSAGQGVRAGVISSLGIMTGCLVHLTAAAAGLSAILASSAMAFSIVKYAGAVYLVYLGVKTLLSKKAAGLAIAEKPVAASNKRIFWQGVLTNVLNPKVALFFLAFLPQFIGVRDKHGTEAIILLGVWFDAGGTVVNIGVAVLFGTIGDRMRKSPGWLKLQEKITGLVLIALGIKVAFTTKR
jgi:threonine/homoserine/homoserine lactone efflux protein